MRGETGQFSEACNIGLLHLEREQAKRHNTSKTFVLHSALNFPTATRLKFSDRLFSQSI